MTLTNDPVLNEWVKHKTRMDMGAKEAASAMEDLSMVMGTLIEWYAFRDNSSPFDLLVSLTTQLSKLLESAEDDDAIKLSKQRIRRREQT